MAAELRNSAIKRAIKLVLIVMSSSESKLRRERFGFYIGSRNVYSVSLLV